MSGSLSGSPSSRHIRRLRWSSAALGLLAVLAVVLTPAANADPAGSGLVAAYGFEEGQGTGAVDSSGHGNNGTIADAVWTNSGAYGRALHLDGSGPGLVVPDSASLHLKRGMTLEAWVKPDEISDTWRDVVYKGDDAYYLEASSVNGGLPAGGGSFGGGQSQAFGAATLSRGQWAYLALTYDGVDLRLYIDGTEVADTPETQALRSSPQPLDIGGDDIYGQYFQGTIDEVRVYNIARTAAEIESDMQTPVVAGASGDPQPPAAPGTLSASAVSASEIDLHWGPATDNVGVVDYDVFRCQGDGCTDFTLLAQVDGTSSSYQDKTVAASSSYSYEVRAVDAAGNDGPFTNTATAATPVAGPGPISVSSSGRYLVNADGTPFLMTGDSPQALIGNLTESDAALYFATRQAQGFNTVWINLLCDDYTGCRNDGSTWDGVPPFTTPGDLSTPNDAYFAHVDRVIQLAAHYGFVVLLDPIETGGWLDTIIANGVDKDRAYGQYLGRRYSRFSNIIWMSGNDYFWDSENDQYVTAVAQGIRDTDPAALQTVELNYDTSGSLDDPAWAPLIDLNASYTYDPTYEQVLHDYDRPTFLPTFMVEASYEGEQNHPTYAAGTPENLRRQEYWSILSGATGQLYGNHYIWPFECAQRDTNGNCVGGWKDQLASPGATQMANLVALFSALPWYELVPDQDHTVVTGGYGSFGGDDYVTAARTPDGKVALAYLPSTRTITVDLGTLAGPVTARWYDPTNGTYTDVGGDPLANSGSVSLTPPGANAAGEDDWVLVLQAS